MNIKLSKEAVKTLTAHSAEFEGGDPDNAPKLSKANLEEAVNAIIVGAGGECNLFEDYT